MSKLSDRIRPNSEVAPWVVDEIKRLEAYSENLEEIIRETLWMARRYADGRSTYAPTTVNECIDLALKLGIDLSGPPEEMYAKDGMFGEWNPKLQRFEKE